MTSSVWLVLPYCKYNNPAFAWTLFIVLYGGASGWDRILIKRWM